MSGEIEYQRTFQNTDIEIWRERPGEYYSDSIHVTASGGIGIDCGGHVIVAPIRAWHDCGEKLLCVDPSIKTWRWRLGMMLLGWKKKTQNNLLTAREIGCK